MPAAAGSRLRRLPRDPAGAGSRPSSGTRSSGSTTRSLPAGGRASSASSRQSRARCALRPAEMARAEQLPLTQAAAAEATRLRVRGRSWLWAGAAVVFLLAAFFTGVLVGPVDLGLADIGREAASHIPFLGVKSHLS